MAGDWIKMRCNLWTHPKVALMAMRTRQPKAMIVGALHGAWGLLDQHGDDGTLAGLTLEMLDAQVECDGFGAAMRDVGWLSEVDGGLEFPDYEEHNGATAKRRAADAKRKGNVRKTSATRPHQCGHTADKSAEHAEQIREEEKREDKSTENPPKSPQGESGEQPSKKKSPRKPHATPEHYVEAEPSLDSPRLRAAIEEWLQHRRESGKTVYAGDQTVTKQAKRLAEYLTQFGPDGPLQSIEQGIAGGYQGLFPPRGSPQQQTRRGVDVNELDLDSKPDDVWS